MGTLHSLRNVDKCYHEAIQALNHHSKRIFRKKFQINQEMQTPFLSKEVIKAHKNELEELCNQRSQFNRVILSILASLPSNSRELKARIKRETFRLNPFTIKGTTKVFSSALPSLAFRMQIEDQVKKYPVSIIQGATGSGKSTQIPAYISELFDKPVLCTQPRKIAAISLADRVQFEYTERHVSSSATARTQPRAVGYNTGKVQPGKRIVYITEQRLLQKLLKPNFDLSRKYSAIILDEAHERSITMDVLLGLLKAHISVHPSLKLVVTSATLDIPKFCGYFQNVFPSVGSLEIPGRTFPIDIHYRPLSGKDKYLDVAVDMAVNYHLHDSKRSKGDVLVFLTGQDELESAIQLATQALKRSKNVRVLSLYGKQPPEEQQTVFELDSKNRKIIFSTNIAETSLTIPGVTCVIDTGLQKQVRFDSQRNMSVMEVEQISRSSAIQRAGRAGRTAPGICYRLYSEETFQIMAVGSTPEILRSALGLTILTLSALGIDMATFDWIDKPNVTDIGFTKRDLMYLQALEFDGKITPFGRRAVEMQLEPRISRMICYADSQGLLAPALTLAALMGVSIWWRGGDDAKKKLCDTKRENLIRSIDPNLGNFGDLVAAYRVFIKWYTLDSWWQVDQQSEPLPETESFDSVSQVDPFEMEETDEDNDLLTSLISRSRIDEFLQEQSFLDADYDSKSDTDSASVASEDSFHSVNSQKKLGRKKKRILQQKWCVENSLNNKNLQIVASTRNEIRQLGKLKVDFSSASQVSDEQLVELILSGFFLSISKKSLSNHYHCIVQGVDAEIQPGSVSMETNSPYILYQELRRTKRNFLTGITPIKFEWLGRVLPPWLCEQFRNNIALCQRDSARIEPVSRTVISKIIGKYSVNVPRLEKLCNAILEFDYSNGSITIWATPAGLPNATKIIKDLILFETQKIAQEEHEEPIIGSTRAVFGEGAKIKQVLVASEFSRVNLSNLPMEITEQAIIAHISGALRYHLPDLITFVQIDRTTQQCNATVGFSEPRLAAKAVALVNHSLLGNLTIGCIQNTSNSVSNCQFRENTFTFSIPTGKLTGYGRIVFRSGKDANEALLNYNNIPDIQHAQIKLTIPRSFPKNHPRKVSPDGKKYVHDPKVPLYQVNLFNVSHLFSEVSLMEMFSVFGEIVVCELYREFTGVDDMEFALAMSLVGDNNNVERIDIPPQASTKLSKFVMEYPTLQEAMDKLKAVHDSDLQVCNQSLQGELKLLGSVSFHSDVFRSIQKQLAALKQKAFVEGVFVEFDNNEETKRALCRCSVVATSANPNKAYVLNEKLDRVFGTFVKLLTPALLPLQDSRLFFNYRGRMELQRLAKSKNPNLGFLHWDKATKSVRVFGDPSQIAFTMNELQKFTNQLRQFAPVWLFPAKRGNLRAMVSKIEQVDGIFAVEMEGRALQIFGHPQAVSMVKSKFSLLDKAPQIPLSGSGSDKCCQICYDDENLDVELHACGHRYCSDCFQGKMNPNDLSVLKFPICCDYPNCQKPLVWRDIVSHLDGDTLQRVLQYSFRVHVQTHIHEYVPCFGLDCNQVFKKIQQGEYNCDTCRTVYCASCCNREKKPVLLHPSKTCAEVRASTETLDLASLGFCACPQCRAPIEKNGGCYHMSCASCKVHFCWGCMVIKSYNHSDCSCGNAWGSKHQDCNYVYHHMASCSRPINK
jgi:HrpA-like RNA helicase